MDVDKEWGTDYEMIPMAELLSTNIYSFNVCVGSWAPYNAWGADATGPSIYLKFANGNHFQVVISITYRPIVKYVSLDNLTLFENNAELSIGHAYV